MDVRLSPWMTAGIIAVLLVVIYVVYATVDSPKRHEAEIEKAIAATVIKSPPPGTAKSPGPAAVSHKTPTAKVSAASK